MNAGKDKKKQYETVINSLANDFFGFSQDDTDNISARNILKAKLWTELWKYYKDIQYTGFENNDERTAEKYSDVINDTIARGMAAYKPEAGIPFLHYVNKAVKNEISRERQKSCLYGLKVPQKLRQDRKRLYDFSQYKGIKISDTVQIKKLGELLGYTEEYLQQVLDFGKLKIGSDIITVAGAERSIFETIESGIGNPEKEFEKKEEAETALLRLSIIDEVFKKKQKRVQAYVSAILTLHFRPALAALNKINGGKKRFAFVDTELYTELDELESKGLKIPAQQDIAARFARDKTDASRTLKNFLKELEKLSTV